MRSFLFLIRCLMTYAQTVRLCLSSWITHLLTAVPPRSRATFVELLCGCLISPEGWVTRAISAITRGRHWTTYYKLLERGSVRTLRLARALFGLVDSVLPEVILNLVIDDTLIPRQSETAPGSAIRHDHAKKTNRPQFLQAQCWVTLGVSVLGNGGRKYVLPIVSRLVPIAGNRNKLTIALALVRSLAPVMIDKPVRVLFDAWFMRARLVLPLLSRKMRVIGQARRDTALFLPPVVFFKPGRGRPKIYGVKMTSEAIQALPVTELKLMLYGKEQLIRLRSVVAMARFLKGTPVRAVWCSFYDADKQRWSKARLAVGDRNRIECRGDPASICTPLGYRTLVSQPETLVGREQSVAAKTHGVGTLDADSFDSVDTGSAIEPGRRRTFPHHRSGTVAQQTTADRRIARKGSCPMRNEV